MSRLDVDLNDTTLRLSELETQYEQYLQVRVGRDETQLDDAIRELMLLLYDLAEVEPTLKEAVEKWKVTVLLYTGALKMK